MKVEPYYRTDIKTDEDLIKWLREKDDSLRVRNPYRKKAVQEEMAVSSEPIRDNEQSVYRSKEDLEILCY